MRLVWSAGRGMGRREVGKSKSKDMLYALARGSCNFNPQIGRGSAQIHEKRANKDASHKT